MNENYLKPPDIVWKRLGDYEVQILSSYKYPDFAARIILEGWKKCGCPKDSMCVRRINKGDENDV